jgi:hypothetical protein
VLSRSPLFHDLAAFQAAEMPKGGRGFHPAHNAHLEGLQKVNLACVAKNTFDES